MSEKVRKEKNSQIVASSVPAILRSTRPAHQQNYI